MAEPLQTFVVKPLTSQGMFVEVHVEYEWLPKRCGTCHLFGHNCTSATHVPPKEAVPSHNPDPKSKAPLKSSQQWKAIGRQVVRSYEAGTSNNADGRGRPHSTTPAPDNTFTMLDVPHAGAPSREASPMHGNSLTLINADAASSIPMQLVEAQDTFLDSPPIGCLLNSSGISNVFPNDISLPHNSSPPTEDDDQGWSKCSWEKWLCS